MVDVAAAHVDVMKRAHVVMDGPGQGANGGESDEEADGGKQEAAAGPVGNVLTQQVAKASFVQEIEKYGGGDRHED
jgi:hypothetical protein